MVLQEIKEPHQRGHCVLKVAGKSLRLYPVYNKTNTTKIVLTNRKCLFVPTDQTNNNETAGASQFTLIVTIVNKSNGS